MLRTTTESFFTSRAVCYYIAEKYANQGLKLIPNDLEEKAIFEQAASIEYPNFDSFCSKAVASSRSMRGVASDKAVFDALVEALSGKLDG
ncbi:hypothetical protein C8F04DRAFT_1252746 [Mycena alexandri]|uniref:Glutathione S-transferase n=1 Tax=Mycena alexandri TaxID=1745969 RepID=A0AAD6T9E9_9AGAR|nr:hypothetical protein C8F04DRAFT_1252746 [Mycena alexandri]